MATKTEDVIELIKGMTLLELKDLNDKIKEEFGVTAMAPMAMAASTRRSFWKLPMIE